MPATEAPENSQAPSWLQDSPGRQLLVVGLFLLVLTFALHGSALDGNWRADDGDHLRFALKHKPWQYFFVPEVNRAHHTATITPWNVFFYDVNLAIFGFRPAGHYLHLLLLIAASATILFALLRRSFSLSASLAGAVALLVAPPTIHIAQFLMVGHYATGLLFCLTAAYGWVRFLEGGKSRWLFLGSVSYLLATLCKEVAVPLVIVLPFLGSGGLRKRLLAFIPFVGIALGYTAWRRVVLGVFLGGSAPTGEGFQFLETARQLGRVPWLLLGAGGAGVIAIVLCLAGIALLAGRGLFRWPLAAAIGVAIAIPMVPLTIAPGIQGADRYLFFPAVALAILVAALLPADPAPWWRFIPACGILVALVFAHVSESRAIRGELRRMDALYGFALKADRRTQGLYVDGDHGYLMTVLSAGVAARDLFEGKPPGERLTILTDTAAALPVLSGPEWTGKTFFRYHEGAMRQMSAPELASAVSAQLGALGRGGERTLRVALSHESGTLRWEFGPWEGVYQVNLEEGGLQLGRKGAHPWAADRPIEMSVCYEGPESWVACSPRLRFEPSRHSLVWTGRGVGRSLPPASSPP